MWHPLTITEKLMGIWDCIWGVHCEHCQKSAINNVKMSVWSMRHRLSKKFNHMIITPWQVSDTQYYEYQQHTTLLLCYSVGRPIFSFFTLEKMLKCQLFTLLQSKVRTVVWPKEPVAENNWMNNYGSWLSIILLTFPDIISVVFFLGS